MSDETAQAPRMTKGEFLSMMTDYASLYREKALDNIAHNQHLHDMNEEQTKQLIQEQVDAVLEDYINWVAYNWGVDYALRACDLPNHATKVKGLMVVNKIEDDIGKGD